MNYKYGELTNNQVEQTKKKMRNQIFFLLLIVDKKTKDDYENINVEEAFDNILTNFSGINELLLHPQEMVEIMSLLEAALLEYRKEDFSYKRYRKLILDAGNKVLNVCKEV